MIKKLVIYLLFVMQVSWCTAMDIADWKTVFKTRSYIEYLLIDIQYYSNTKGIVEKCYELCGTYNIKGMVNDVIIPLLEYGKKFIDNNDKEAAESVLYTLFFPNEVLNTYGAYESYHNNSGVLYCENFDTFFNAIHNESRYRYKELLGYFEDNNNNVNK